MVLEDTGVAAYQGQAGNIKAHGVSTAAISIHPVGGRVNRPGRSVCRRAEDRVHRMGDAAAGTEGKPRRG